MVPLILDTDIGTDVDDALALAFALRHPGIDLRAVTTVSGDTRLRARLAAKLLHLAGRDDVEVAAGLTEPPGSRPSTIGHEGAGLLVDGEQWAMSGRGTVDVLLSDDGATVATVGMQTNVAAAVERDPTYPGRVPLLAVMGGVFRPLRPPRPALPPGGDHNLAVDPAASLRALNAGFRTLYVPLDVTLEVPLTRAHLDRLRRGDDLCRALAAQVEIWAPVLHRITGGLLPDDVVAYLHDPLTVACVVERGFVSTEVLPVTVAVHDGAVRTFIDPIVGRPAEVVRSVDGPAFADYWLETVTT